MTAFDEELRRVLDEALPEPRIRDTQVLLETLTARVATGGADVADLPLPTRTTLTAVPAVPQEDEDSPQPGSHHEWAEVSSRAPSGRRWARLGTAVAGLGVAGWVAVGLGSAAAAVAGAWLVTHADTGHDQNGPDTPLVIERAMDDEGLREPESTHVAAVSPPQRGYDMVDGPATPTEGRPDRGGGDPEDPTQDTRGGASDGQAAHEGDGERQGASISAGKGSAVDTPAVDHDATGEAPQDDGAIIGTELETPGDGTNGGTRDVLGSVADGATGIVEDVEDTVVGALPEGPVRDTVAPIVGAVNVSGLVAGLLNTLVCAADGALTVSASDNVGVESVTVRLSVGGSTLLELPLSPTAGGTWAGSLAPLDLSLLGLQRVVDVTVTAVDAAGNTGTTIARSTARLVSCLG